MQILSFTTEFEFTLQVWEKEFALCSCIRDLCNGRNLFYNSSATVDSNSTSLHHFLWNENRSALICSILNIIVMGVLSVFFATVWIQCRCFLNFCLKKLESSITFLTDSCVYLINCHLYDEPNDRNNSANNW